jgi:multiple sugar transport system permease protein
VRRRLAVGEVAITAALYLITAVGAVIMLLPFYWMVASSLMTLPEIIARPPVWFPRVPQLHNYADLAAALPIDRIYINSLIVTISVTSLVLFTSSLTGFGFAKYHFPGRDTLFLLVLATMMIPFFLLLIPVFFIVKVLGWVDTYLGLIVPNAVTAYGIFLMRQFILGVPDELLDAARIDGSSEFGLYWRIVLPLSGPALAALTILAFLYHWNAFLWPLVVIRSQDLWTIPIGLNNLRLYASSTDTLDLQMAGATIAVVPVLVVFVALQRYFIQGITLSGLKG